MSSVNGDSPAQLTARFLQAVRDEPFLTHREIAAEAGIALRSIYDWESGNAQPNKKSLRKINTWLEQRTAA